MATFFQAWRKRQADQQAAEWLHERDEARRAAEGAPTAIRHDIRRVMETLIEGADEEVGGALDELGQLLEPYPDLRAHVSRLRIYEDAKASLSRRG